MVKAAENEKAARYIQQLDEARCAGSWKEVPELCRKVEKHAPHRQCLTLTARTEAQIAAYSTQRPATASPTAASSLSQAIPALLTAIEAEGEHSQDAFHATVCQAWLHFVLDEPGLAVARLPNDCGEIATRLSEEREGTPLSAWSRVCLVKGAYLKGSALEKTGATGPAVTAYASVVPWLGAATSPSTETVQFKLWSEHLLVRLCQLSDQSSSGPQCVDVPDALQTYRYWARFCDGTAKSGGPDTATSPRHRRLAWKAYYDTLSTIVQHHLAYEPESAATQEKPPLHSQPSMRLRQRAELKRVETTYEHLLIKETQFPRASESNREIETWVDSVMDNWRLFCGPAWSDDDLGEGGKEGVARSVLDILYRAATKTFHSTQILRHLFVVHASLAEFELAFKAYDSYVEIITRGKDRAEKSDGVEVAIDSDSTILRTSAQAIRLLCRFGSRKEAEKALAIGHDIEKWMEQSHHVNSASDAGSTASTETQVESTALAAAYCAMGISQAHWARLTYEVETRAQIQARAVQHLRKSLSPNLGDFNNLNALYALALVLAEMRDIPGAIKVAKRALSPTTKEKTVIGTDGLHTSSPTTEYGRERKLIPLWHLLALLLTSRSEFTAAEKACEAAFEQFGNSAMLFGAEDSSEFCSEHLNQAAGKDESSQGIVDGMEAFEKTSVLQIKMTQLSLLEVTDGSSAAVDSCGELIALYGRLFGDSTTDLARLDVFTAPSAMPKTAAPTSRTSIFRGRGSTRAKDIGTRNSVITTAQTSPVIPQPSIPPAIQVTNDDHAAPTNGHHHHHHLIHRHKHEDEKVGVVRTPSKLQKRSASLRRVSVAEGAQMPEVPPLPDHVTNGTSNTASAIRSHSPRRLSISSAPRKSVESGDRQLRPMQHNMSQISPPLGHPDQPLRQDTRLPAPLPHADYIPPDPHFSQLQERRHKVSVLSAVWIFISGLYTRAQMYDDAKEAVAEAFKLVESFEAEVSIESSSAKALAEKGWGGGKSVEELWADAFAARGELLAAQSFKHHARTDFERALLHFPDHPSAIVGLSEILLDIHTEAIPFEPPHSETDMIAPFVPPSVSSIQQDKVAAAPSLKTQYLTSHTPSAENQLSPPELNRLAARDRAFGLLSTLTKLGAGWDYSEAWYALARAYEESAQKERTQEVLWWCVELEDTRPLRKWAEVGMGGFVL